MVVVLGCMLAKSGHLDGLSAAWHRDCPGKRENREVGAWEAPMVMTASVAEIVGTSPHSAQGYRV
jgi:hypothetical protein